MALLFLLTVNQWEDLAQCESSGRWFINTGNGYYGGLQIDEETWIEHGGLRYTRWPHYASKEIQILVAENILADQGFDAWPVCSIIVGLR